MAQQLSRKTLYDLVWSEPMKSLSKRFAVSDVAFKQACVRAAIPTPYRGYWAEKEAGKMTLQAPLPARAPGLDDQVSIGGGRHDFQHYRTEEELLGSIGPPPEFSEPIEDVRARIAETVGRVNVPPKVGSCHPAIDRLVKEGEKWREKQLTASYVMSWDKPLFDSPVERRRLRILNSLFFAVAKMNGKASVRGPEARDIGISFFHQHLHLALDRPKRSNRRAGVINAGDKSSEMSLCLSILQGWGSEAVLATWDDGDTEKLEMLMTDIAIQVILTAEIQYRESAVRQYEWRVQRKAQLEEEERKRGLEAERTQRERQKRIEQERINRLLIDAASFQQAQQIREYVEAIRISLDGDGSSVEAFEKWRQWALAQADRIDPALGGRFLNAMQDRDAS